MLTTASAAPVAAFQAADAPLVSIVIVAYGTGPILAQTLASVATNTSDDLAVEVIVVSNPHPELGQHSLVELRLSTRGVRVLTPETNLGFGGGCELGALHARGEFLAFVNPDVDVPPRWLEPLTEAAASDESPIIAAPVLLNADGTVQEAGQLLSSTGVTSPLTAVPAEVSEVDYASAACWVMTAETHARLGGFDPAFHPAYFEDVDLALRARSMGGRCVVVPTVQIVHHRGGGTPEAAEPANAQRDVLLARWPEIAWKQRATRAGLSRK